ncbi:MAG: KEOPS complex subunit Pcc1 [Thaumarchaeota archaeon]|nr:KEOPS complex subunit Pcc1 [Nitrososphaerota archaeon]MCY3976220.1 KEOPS complex subunit Pcc1 [Nitrososphaerota archaeon]
MTLNFNVHVIYDALDKTKAIFDSISTDSKFYPEQETKTKITIGNHILLANIDSSHIQHVRANLNTLLRLMQACFDSLESIKIYEKS